MDELLAIIKFKLLDKSTPLGTGNLAKCYHYLKLTSRSFEKVIRNLDEELMNPVCIFYLVLRGLDTIGT